MPTNKELSIDTKRLDKSVSRLIEEVHLLKAELKKFKADVAHDVSYLTQQANKNR